MATSNIKLFDENKANMLTDSEYNSNTQRQNGVQSGVASSKLNNKNAYQVSLVAYAIGQLMVQNGKDANDADAVSTFVANMDATLVQKVKDIASSDEAKAGVNTSHFMTPYTTKAAIEEFINEALNTQYEETEVVDYNIKFNFFSLDGVHDALPTTKLAYEYLTVQNTKFLYIICKYSQASASYYDAYKIFKINLNDMSVNDYTVNSDFTYDWPAVIGSDLYCRNDTSDGNVTIKRFNANTLTWDDIVTTARSSSSRHTVLVTCENYGFLYEIDRGSKKWIFLPESSSLVAINDTQECRSCSITYNDTGIFALVTTYPSSTSDQTTYYSFYKKDGSATARVNFRSLVSYDYSDNSLMNLYQPGNNNILYVIVCHRKDRIADYYYPTISAYNISENTFTVLNTFASNNAIASYAVNGKIVLAASNILVPQGYKGPIPPSTCSYFLVEDGNLYFLNNSITNAFTKYFSDTIDDGGFHTLYDSSTKVVKYNNKITGIQCMSGFENVKINNVKVGGKYILKTIAGKNIDLSNKFIIQGAQDEVQNVNAMSGTYGTYTYLENNKET